MPRKYPKNKTVEQRFFEKYVEEPNTGCWLWTGYCTPQGYGHFKLHGKATKSNRAAWEIFVGDMPRDMLVLHKCNVPSCVNPEHLFLGTQQDRGGVECQC